MSSLLALLVVACAPTPSDTAAGAVNEEEDEVTEAVVAPPPPLLTEEEALAAIGIGTRNGLPDPLGMYDTYIALMALGDSECPGPVDQLMDTYVPLTGCLSDSGLYYAGVSMVLTEADLGEGTADMVARLIGGDFTITDAAGDTLDFGGQVMWSGQATDTGRSISAQVLGTFAYPGGSPWLAVGTSAVLEMHLERTDGGGAALGVAGGLGTEGVDLWFEGFTVDPAVCDTPTGAIGVRDPSGAWWTLDLAVRCDGCGILSYPGRPDVEACVELEPLYTGAVAMLERSP